MVEASNPISIAMKYKHENDRSALAEIFRQYDPLIKKTVSRYRATGIPGEIIETEAKLVIAEALKKYDPEKGSLPGYINTNLKAVDRAINNLSPVYVPQATASKLGEYRTKLEEFRDKNERIPTFEEMAGLMNVSKKESERIMQATTRQVGMTGEDFEVGVRGRRGKDVMMEAETIYGKLDNDREKEVLEYIFGLHGKPAVKSDREMGQRVGTSESTIRNIKDRIINVYEREYGI